MLSPSSGNTVIKSKLISRRMFLLTAAKAVVMVGIIGRLVSLQINERTKYKTLSDKNRFREWKLAPERGVIKDFFDKEIASNEQVYQVHLIPENSKDIEKLFVRLRTILNITDKRLFYLRRIITKQKPWEPIIISDNITWSEFSRLNLFLHELQGVKPVVSVARMYPDNSSAHILGYVSQVSAKDLQTKKYLKDLHVPGMTIGKTGLERKLDEEIIGKIGFQRYEVNAYGKRIRQIVEDEGQAGKSFKTTLDFEVQKFTSELLKDKAASVCVMDIYNGDIVSMVSSPTFEPNEFVHGLDKKYWNSLIKNELRPLTNKSISGLYPPGSTIKTLVALSALENGIIKPLDTFRCNGKIELYGEKFHCWEKDGHGIVNLRKGIQRSCDVYFYEVARKLGVDRLSETAKKFGLGKKVFGELFENEKKGLVPNTIWKKNALGQSWVLGETIITGIGQGFIQTTPIQLCLMTAQIANGGYKIYPKIVLNNDQQYLDKYKPLFKNSKNIKLIQKAMFSSTNEVRGTSYKSRIDDPKYQFAGKTGTAQVKRITEKDRELDLKTFEIPYEERDHALYVAFGPYKNPRYATSIIIEHGGSGGTTAAPIAKKLFKLIIDRHKLRQSVKEKKYWDI